MLIKRGSNQGPVAKAVTLVTWEAEIRKTAVQGQPSQNVSKTPSQPIAECVVYMPVIPAMERINRKIVVQASVDKK
jgi:hypothetical protein